MVEHPVDAPRRPVDRRAIEARQPIRQARADTAGRGCPTSRWYSLNDGDDLGGVLGAEPRPENRAADDLGGQRRHLAQRVDRRAVAAARAQRSAVSAAASTIVGANSARLRAMHDRRDDAAALLPGFAVADESARRRSAGTAHAASAASCARKLSCSAIKACATVSGLLQTNTRRFSSRVEKNWYSKHLSSKTARKLRRAAASIASGGSGSRGRSG